MVLIKTDVIVIGGGIAGSAAAFFLSRKGIRVTVLDKTRFPRDKICTSTVNPYTMTYLLKMGVMRELLKDQMLPIEGIRAISYEGKSFVGYYGDSHFPYVNFGHTIPRYRLDEAMTNRVRQVKNVKFLENWSVEEILYSPQGRAIGVRGKHNDHVENLYADVIVDAAGRGSILARAKGWFEPIADHERYAVVCQFDGVVPPSPTFTVGTDHHVGPGYYCVFPITEHTAIIAFIVDPLVFSDLKSDPNAWVDNFVRRPEWIGQEWLAGATRSTKVVTFGPLAFRTKKVVQNGVLLIGDTTGFYDPLTGEGIGFAIYSGELAAETVYRLLGAGFDWNGEHNRFAEKIITIKEERTEQVKIMHRMLKRPIVYNRFVESLSKNQDAANWAARSFANMLVPGEEKTENLFSLITNKR
ncbi:NAD(P)/FAD-dependent oxidoreductase [Kroppenstedtia pulmonis]|uniref:NAD(P)/FAD-dependent oxidoreductase n=1 Tax=Kroppenstedtia pulmonis TaxID=1380685 RepID=A0A7D3Y828_9BACL|nr:NAD(P)/FAD-dependent oxidoreductase [Kroppenstedtia pulmonis]QKG83261.1 NAD(P)/FAD-dependent oxidoreductase [Kroppenstedtia pulmonis]